MIQPSKSFASAQTTLLKLVLDQYNQAFLSKEQTKPKCFKGGWAGEQHQTLEQNEVLSFFLFPHFSFLNQADYSRKKEKFWRILIVVEKEFAKH